MNRPVKASFHFALTAAVLISTAAEARMYRYTDENGQLVISNTVPSEASTRGYEILNDKGWVVETIAPAPTEEELAERAAAERREKEQAAQRKEDATLLKRFSHPDEAVRAMYRKLQEMQSLNQLKRGNIAVIVNQLDDVQSRAADMERSGREIPATTLEKIDRLQSQIREIEREIVVQNAEIAAVKKQFHEDIRRLEKITGKERTLPLEPSAADMAGAD